MQEQQISQSSLKVFGFKIFVTDLQKALEFYRNTVGLKLETVHAAEGLLICIDKSGHRLIFEQAGRIKQVPLDRNVSTILSLEVRNLDENVKFLRARHVTFPDETIRKEGVGRAIYISDPFGNRISLIQLNEPSANIIEGSKIYNFGIYNSNSDRSIKFYTNELGFTILTDKFMPRDMPLFYPDSRLFAFVLHFRDVVPVRATAVEKLNYGRIVFEGTDIDGLEKQLKFHAIPVSRKSTVLVFSDPDGIVLEVVPKGRQGVSQNSTESIVLELALGRAN